MGELIQAFIYRRVWSTNLVDSDFLKVFFFLVFLTLVNFFDIYSLCIRYIVVVLCSYNDLSIGSPIHPFPH